MTSFVRAVLVVLLLGAFACRPEPRRAAAPVTECSIVCPTPPAACRYEEALTTGACDALTCGRLRCPDRTALAR